MRDSLKEVIAVNTRLVNNFIVTTPGATNSELELNFQPMIDKFGFKGNFILIHWQARPKGHREMWLNLNYRGFNVNLVG